MPPGETVLFGHLTDVHVVGAEYDDDLHVDNNGRLRSVVDRMCREDPPVEAVLATGDLTAWGREGDYAMLAEILAPIEVPVLAIPGNHDDRDGVRRTFADLPWADADHASWVTSVNGVRVIGLDSTIPGAEGARFDDDRESWLRSVLDDDHDGVTILTLHHPPMRSGIEWMDRSGFEGRERLWEVLRDAPVDRILAGHLHRSITATVSGIHVQVGLPTIESIELDLAPNPTPRLVFDPIGYGLMSIRDDTIVSHTRFVGTGHEPFVPSWADSYPQVSVDAAEPTL